MPTFPNVPIAPGVPPVLRQAGSVVQTFQLLTADAVTLLGGLFGLQWGIFQNGAPIIVPDTMVSLEYHREWTISNYPLEQGNFESYDKVQLPFEARVRIATGGSVADRGSFISQVESIAATLELYDIVTPERVYGNVNIESFEYRRTATQGAGMIVIDLHLIEIRQVVSQSFNNTQAASGASSQGQGQVAPVPATPAQTATMPLIKP